MFRFLPTIFFPASMPWPAAGTLVEVLSLYASITPADGSASRPSFSRSSRLSRPLSCEQALVRPIGEVAVDRP